MKRIKKLLAVLLSVLLLASLLPTGVLAADDGSWANSAVTAFRKGLWYGHVFQQYG